MAVGGPRCSSMLSSSKILITKWFMFLLFRPQGRNGNCSWRRGASVRHRLTPAVRKGRAFETGSAFFIAWPFVGIAPEAFLSEILPHGYCCRIWLPQDRGICRHIETGKGEALLLRHTRSAP